MSELVVIIRPSFMKFCKDGCRAAAFNHLLYWIARKAKGEPVEKIQAGEVMWYATTEEITEGLANAWGVCKVRQEVNRLISMGLIGKGRNPAWGVDRTKHFFFGQEQCSKFIQICQEQDICLHRLGLSKDVLHLIKSSFAQGSTLKCVCGQMIDLSDHLINSSDHLIDPSNAQKEIERKSPQANDKSIRTITKEESLRITTKDDRQRREFLATLSTQHQSLFALICELKEIKLSKLNEEGREKVIGQLDELIANGISTAEQLRELHGIACRDLANKGKDTRIIFLGNIVNALDEWKLNNTPWNAEVSTPELEEQVKLPEKTLSDCVDQVVGLASLEDSQNLEWYIDWICHIWKLAQERGTSVGELYDAIFRAKGTLDKRYKKRTGQAKMDVFMDEVEGLIGVVLVPVEVQA